MSKSQEEDYELPWDFYLYIGRTLLGYSDEYFWEVTPNGLLRQYIKHLEYTNPDALNKEKVIYTLDQTPFFKRK